MSKGFNTRLVVVALILTTALAAVGCSRGVQGDEAEASDYVAVETETAAVAAIANTTGFNGRIAANEELMIIPKTVGVVSTVNVKLGERVTKDTILFTLEQEDMSKSVEQADNSLSLAQKSVDQALNSLNTAELNFELNKEKIENAILNLERNRELYQLGAISKSQLEQSEMAASNKQLAVAEAQVKQAEIAYQQSLNQLRQAEIAHQQSLSGFDNTVVRAPMDGVVSALNVKVGQIATNSQAAVVLVDTESVYMQLNVVEGMVNKLTIGQEALVRIPAAQDTPIAAVVDYISPAADTRSQLYPVKIYLPNPEGIIRPGMNGEASLGIDRVDSAIVIKSSAVLDRNGKKVVYVLEGDSAVEKVVEVGLDTGDLAEIKSGLQAGEQVIVKGQHYVEDGQTVKVVRGE